MQVMDANGDIVGTMTLGLYEEYKTKRRYFMQASVDSGPSMGYVSQTVVLDKDLNPLGIVREALLFLDPDNCKSIEGEIVDADTSASEAGTRHLAGGQPGALPSLSSEEPS